MEKLMWYFKSYGKQFGPITDEKLRQMVQAGEIDRETKIRRDASQTWVAAGDFPGLFPKIKNSGQRRSTREPTPVDSRKSRPQSRPQQVDPVAHSEEKQADFPLDEIMDVLEPAGSQPIEKAAPPPQRAAIDSQKVNLGTTPLDDSKYAESPQHRRQPADTDAESPRRPAWVINSWSIPRLSQISELRRSHLMVMGVAILILLWRGLSLFSGPSDNSIYETLSQVSSEFNHFRQQGATSAEWNAFGQRVETQLEPLIEHLERTANSEQRSKQELLWAGRDCWSVMLARGRKDSNHAEEKFTQHLENARILLDGGQLNDSILSPDFPAIPPPRRE